MRNLGPAVKVGVTFLIVGAMGYWSFQMLAKGSCAGEQEMLTVHAYFKDATRLFEKSGVQIAGLNVGHIVSRELNVRPPRKELAAAKRFAKITVALRPGVTLYSNATIYKRSASLLGEYYLEIDPGTYEWWERDGVAVSRASCDGAAAASCKRHVGERIGDRSEVRFVGEAATASKVVDQVSELMPEIRGLASDIRAFVRGPMTKIGQGINEGIAENRKALAGILANVDGITRDVQGITRTAPSDVRQILADIKSITGNLRQVISGGKDGQGYGSQLKQGMNKLTSAIDKLDSSLDNVDKITGDLQQGKGTVGRLLKDDALVNDVEEIVHEAGAFVKSLTGLQTIVGLRSEYNFAAGTIKTYLTVELRPRPDKYYLIELIDDPRGRRSVSAEITRSDDPSQPVLTRQEKVTITDAFRISFQFAKRIGYFTFRFGIKESTGGIGADVHLFDDRINLQTDVFDFQANVYPRFKAVLAWEFFKSLYIVGGIDDAINDRPRDGTGGGRDFFVGGQIRFNDEDLRQLLLVGGGALGGSVSSR